MVVEEIDTKVRGMPHLRCQPLITRLDYERVQLIYKTTFEKLWLMPAKFAVRR